MSARALVIKENDVLRFVESPKRNDNGLLSEMKMDVQ